MRNNKNHFCQQQQIFKPIVRISRSFNGRQTTFITMATRYAKTLFMGLYRSG